METFDFIEMRVPAKPEYVGVIRLSVSGVANRMGYNYEEIEDLKVSVAEAVTNVVEHAYDNEESGEIAIGIGVYEDRLEVMVSDQGESFDLKEAKKNMGPYQSNESIESLREGGFGLFLIDALMDKVEINNEYGVMVLMTKYLHKDGVNIDDGRISSQQ